MIYTKEYTTTQAVNFDPIGTVPTWIHTFGAGQVVVVEADGTESTYATAGGEVIRGAFSRLVSFTCAKIRIGTGPAPEIGSSVPVSTSATVGGVSMSVAPASAANPIAVGANDPAFTESGALAFGDGSDGDLVFDGAEDVLGITPSDDVYTLDRDIYAADMTVDVGITVYAAGFRIFCSGTLTNNGTIHNDGNDAVDGTAGAVTNASGSTGVGTAGGAGKAGNGAGSAGTTQASGFPGGSGEGGAGGTDGTNGGGEGGTWTALSAVKGGARSAFPLSAGVIVGTASSGTASAVSLICGGSGGGGGGGDNADAVGGGGGGGGGLLILCGKTIVNNGIISANGGDGADGTSAANNAGGGGGGGGGVVVVISRAYSGSGTVVSNGGAGGIGDGTAGEDGEDGEDGVVIQSPA